MLRFAFGDGSCIASVFLTVAFSLVPGAAFAQSTSGGGPLPRTLIVGVATAPPFVIAEKGGYRGLSVDLWRETAEEYGWSYDVRRYDFPSLLEAVSRGEIDVGIGAITTTAERERRMDFSHPVFTSGIGVAIQRGQSAGWVAVLSALWSMAFLKLMLFLLGLLFLVGFLAWFAERKHNPEHFGGTHAEGILAGVWWAMVTLTTVGYGDVAPRTWMGRLIGLGWMFSGFVLVAFFTASITSALTVGELRSSIRSASDLAGRRIATVVHTTSEEWLERERLAFRTHDALPGALAALKTEKADVVVFDTPLLAWTIRRDHRSALQVLPVTLERQDYAFALPRNSPLRESIDQALLERINSPDWPSRVAAYLGEDVP